MRSFYLLLVGAILACVSGCSQKPSDPAYPITQPKPGPGLFIGTFVPDERTLQLIRDGGYTGNPITIQFIDQSTFSVTNIPDCWVDVEGQSHGKMLSYRGSWDITNDPKHWLISLETTDPAGFSKTAAIIGQGPPFTVRLIVTQPDGDLGLDFVKQ